MAAGGEAIAPESRRDNINLKRVRYQASASRRERGSMLQELVRAGGMDNRDFFARNYTGKSVLAP